MNGQFLINKTITVQYAFKKDRKGERHGTATKRLLATQARKNNALPVASRPPPAPIGLARPTVPGFQAQGPYQGQFAGALAGAQPPAPPPGFMPPIGMAPSVMTPQIPAMQMAPPPPPGVPLYGGFAPPPPPGFVGAFPSGPPPQF